MAVINPRFLPPRAAYVHVPFCRHRCGYCNFTVAAHRDDLIPAFLRALRTELSWLEVPRQVASLYVGGGTPTYLPPEPWSELLTLLRHWFVSSGDLEFTVEANPTDLNIERVGTLVQFGVNRISLGVQSFQPTKLRVLERTHRRVDIEAAMERLRERAIHVALDLIFGVPGETLDDWRGDLDAALEMQPDHLSLYGLAFERGARFYGRRMSGDLLPVAEECERAMYEYAIDRLTAAGFEHYEVSNFARPGQRCQHNEVYWTGRGYHAAGPGAARYVAGRRETNHRSVSTYLKRVLNGKSPVAESEFLSHEDSARERLVFALRRMEGIDKRLFAEETGLDVDQLVGQAITRFAAAGLLEHTPGHVRLTRAGLLVSDSLWPAFLHA